MLPWRSGWKNNTDNSLVSTNPMLTATTYSTTNKRQINVPRVSFSTSLLQRCKQLSSTLNSSSVMWRGAGCMGRSGGSRDWVKGLWIGILCCWAAAGAVVGPDAVPELSKGGSRSCSTVLLVKVNSTTKKFNRPLLTNGRWGVIKLALVRAAAVLLCHQGGLESQCLLLEMCTLACWRQTPWHTGGHLQVETSLDLNHNLNT